MMNDRARLWSKRKSAPFADPRDEERALREMRKSIDHSFNFNIDFKGEQPYMDNYRATVSFGAGLLAEHGHATPGGCAAAAGTAAQYSRFAAGAAFGAGDAGSGGVPVRDGCFLAELAVADPERQHPDWCPDDEHQREAAGE